MLDPSKNTHFSNRITDSYTLYNNGGYYAFQQPQTKTQQNYWNDMGEILAERKLIDDEDSGVSSPPLWRTSPPRSPQHRQNHYRSLSLSSRAQAIARGQKELMEMVSKMPEGCYELSLKDIVEQNIVDQEKQKQESLSQQRNIEENIIRGSEKKKNNDKKVQINRSSSIDNTNRDGFLLKMVFPISLGSKKKKKKRISGAGNNSGRDGRVSPKPLLFDGSAKSNVDDEWWKNRYAETGDTESTGLSSNSGSSKSSGSSSSRNSSRNGSARVGRGGCWPFFFKKREHKEE